jgi:hypothetical protein
LFALVSLYLLSFSFVCFRFPLFAFVSLCLLFVSLALRTQVHHNARGVNAGQRNLADTGIGSFNDRMRETVNGGSPFADPRLQGFATGLSLDPNGFEQVNNPSMGPQCSLYVH